MIRHIIVLLAASTLAACDCYDPLWNSITQRGLILARLCPPKVEYVRETYHSTFPKTSPDSGLVDSFPDGPKQLQVGESGSDKAVEKGNAQTGALSVKAPDDIVGNPSVGLFRTGLNYGQGTHLLVRATFRKPEGPQLPPGDTTNAWAVGVVARDGGLADSPDARRLSVTLRFKDHIAELNVAAGGARLGPPGYLPYPTDKPAPVKISDALYKDIFDEHLPFTLEMTVDRRTGEGAAQIIRDGVVQNRTPFRMLDFGHDFGPAITTAGAALANCCAPKEQVSVEVLDVQIEGQRPK